MLNQKLIRIAILIMAFAVAGALALLGFFTVQNSRYNCTQTEKVKSALYIQFQRSVAAIQDPRTRPAYYKEHPEEVKPTLKIYDQLLTDFAPGSCSGLFGPG